MSLQYWVGRDTTKKSKGELVQDYIRATTDATICRSLLAELVLHEDECVYDHNDMCQTHGYDRQCVYTRAKEVLNESRD